MKRVLLVLALALIQLGNAQDYFPKNDGVKTTDNTITAFTHAKIYVTPTEIIDNGTLLIQKGKILEAGTSVSIPKSAIIIDLSGKSIYPSFIDVFSEFGIDVSGIKARGTSNQYDATREGYYWNDHILPEQKAVDVFEYDSKSADDLIKAGFGAVNTHINDGIVQGTALLVTLNNNSDNNYRILDDKTSQFLSFEKSKRSRQSYPTSLMGAMALIRQFYYDADWYSKGNANNKDLAIEAQLTNSKLPQFFDAGSRQNSVRADKIANEFGINYILKGGGDEYERINDVVATGAKYVIPVNFPDAYDVTDPYLASKVALEDMLVWNQAPTNPGVLAQNGVVFALTPSGNKKASEFISNLQKAIEYGLNETKALEALTTIPASFIGKEKVIGSLKKGYVANFLITSGSVFNKETTVYENWVQGNRNVIEDMNVTDIRGTYTLTANGTGYEMVLSGKLSGPSIELKKDSLKVESKLTYTNGWVTLFFAAENGKDDKTAFTRLSAIAKKDTLKGKGVLADGQEIEWTAIKTAPFEEKKKEKEETKELPELIPVTYPNKAYGFKELPKQQTLLFKNATVWTNEDAGILEQTDVLVKNGKIVQVGKNLSAPDATIIDATGKHLTSGIIDEHSHIAADAVNEAGQNSSAEVTIEDVVDADDINIYRNLSGGVTTIQILHGSANPIGGRSALIKPKWGGNAEDMLIDNAPKFIKFALGENVKQTNWGSGRFPQTRMGVEQVFIDYFQRAQEYNAAWKKYNGLSKKEKAKANAPRYDIEMQTLAEILNKERFITCHSYVQSEINMLMKVAEQFNFNVNTFTHILEGYKVADKMKEHGVGGATFSDWWAYKFEVNDAIPYNAAIMHDAGVTVAINSDDAEMSRRLNQEAAKTIKYGGMTEIEAWKMVTLNPAKLLHLDDKLGSIKPGKDADLVLWSDNPLSIYAIAEKTIIEGTVYYDYETMKATKAEMDVVKNILTNQMIEAKNKGMKTQPAKEKKKELMHCDTL